MNLSDLIVQGDSGGPLACQDRNGVWTVMGITSYGVGVCSSGFDVRVTTFVDYIQQTIERHSTL